MRFTILVIGEKERNQYITLLSILYLYFIQASNQYIHVAICRVLPIMKIAKNITVYSSRGQLWFGTSVLNIIESHTTACMIIKQL